MKDNYGGFVVIGCGEFDFVCILNQHFIHIVSSLLTVSASEHRVLCVSMGSLYFFFVGYANTEKCDCAEICMRREYFILEWYMNTRIW